MDPATITAILVGAAGLITAVITARSSASKSQISDMEKTVKSISEAFDVLQTMNEKLEAKVLELREENEKLRKELDQLRADNKHLREENRKLKGRVQELEKCLER